MLVGNQVPYKNRHRTTPQERAIWDSHRKGFIAEARAGIGVKEALDYVRHPGWEWFADKAG